MADEYTESFTEVYPDEEPQPTFHGSPSTLARVIRLEGDIKQIKYIQYAEGGLIVLCVLGLFAAARVTGKLIKATNEIGMVLSGKVQAVPQQARPMPSSNSRSANEATTLFASREAVDDNQKDTSTASTIGYDPGPQDPTPEVQEALSRDNNLDDIFNDDGI